MVRGMVVGLGVLLVTFWFAPPGVSNPLWIAAFALLGAGMMGTLGLIAGLWAEKFDQLAGFQNFIIMPMTFLSGVFYSVHSLPSFWQGVSHLNPFFYMIDGFRHGFFGVSDASPWLSLAVVGGSFCLVAALALGTAAARLQDPLLKPRCNCPATPYRALETRIEGLWPTPHPLKSSNTSPQACPASICTSKVTGGISSPPSCPRSSRD